MFIAKCMFAHILVVLLCLQLLAIFAMRLCFSTSVLASHVSVWVCQHVECQYGYVNMPCVGVSECHLSVWVLICSVSVWVC